MGRFKSVVGLVLAFGGFEITSRLTDALGLPKDGLWAHLWKWVPAVSLLGFVRYVEKRDLDSIGWTHSSLRRFTTRAIAGTFALLGTSVIAEPLWNLVGEGNDELHEGLGSFSEWSIPERLFIALTAGVTEEIMYRGYAVERLSELIDNSILAGAVSGSLFTIIHTQGDMWSRSAAFRMTQPTAILTVLYLRVRGLPAVISAHVLNDAVGLVLADRYAGDDE